MTCVLPGFLLAKIMLHVRHLLLLGRSTQTEGVQIVPTVYMTVRICIGCMWVLQGATDDFPRNCITPIRTTRFLLSEPPAHCTTTVWHQLTPNKPTRVRQWRKAW